MQRLWSKIMTSVGDFLWFTFFLLIGASLAALFFLTYFIPKRDSLRELVRSQQAELFKARIAYEKARLARLKKQGQSEPTTGGAADGNDLLTKE